MRLDPDDPAWRAAHPDLDEGEIGAIVQLADMPVNRPRPLPGSDARADYVHFLQTSLRALRAELDVRSIKA
jgi:hypothetical protein